MNVSSRYGKRIKVQYIGYKSRSVALGQKPCVNDSVCCHVELQSLDNLLSDVVVLGKSKAQMHREAPSPVTIIDGKALKYKTATLNEILDKIGRASCRE